MPLARLSIKPCPIFDHLASDLWSLIKYSHKKKRNPGGKTKNKIHKCTLNELIIAHEYKKIVSESRSFYPMPQPPIQYLLLQTFKTFLNNSLYKSNIFFGSRDGVTEGRANFKIYLNKCSYKLNINDECLVYVHRLNFPPRIHLTRFAQFHFS